MGWMAERELYLMKERDMLDSPDWIVQAQLVTRTEIGTLSTGLPTFSLDGDVLGILTFSGAARIANALLRPGPGQVAYYSIVAPSGDVGFITSEAARLTEGRI